MNRFVLLVITVALLSLAPRAQAHAFPQSATPAAGSVLAQAPTEVVITFTEALEPRFSSLQVLDAAGARVDTGTAQTAPSDGRIFSTHVKPLLPGSYKVVWHATSVDTHKTEGSYSFTVEK
jgi:methionine-rich copper-binding protein CopC